jgi:hypothetical protein
MLCAQQARSCDLVDVDRNGFRVRVPSRQWGAQEASGGDFAANEGHLRGSESARKLFRNSLARANLSIGWPPLGASAGAGYRTTRARTYAPIAVPKLVKSVGGNRPQMQGSICRGFQHWRGFQEYFADNL